MAPSRFQVFSQLFTVFQRLFKTSGRTLGIIKGSGGLPGTCLVPSRLLVLSKLLTVSNECVRNVVKITRNTYNEGPSRALLGSSRFPVVVAAFKVCLWFCKNCGQARGGNTANCGPRGHYFLSFHNFSRFPMVS